MNQSHGCLLKILFLLVNGLGCPCRKQRLFKFGRAKHNAVILNSLGRVQTDVVVGKVHLAGTAVGDESVDVIFLLHSIQRRLIQHFHFGLNPDLS